MDFQSAMETFAEAWAAATAKGGGLTDSPCPQSQAMSLSRSKSQPSSPAPRERSQSPGSGRPPSSAAPPSAPGSSPAPVPTPGPVLQPPPLRSASPSRSPRSPTPSPAPEERAFVSAGATPKDHDPSGKPSGKSVPVHCVVEAVCSVDAERSPWRSKRTAVIEMDSYVIIPVATPFVDLVPVVLARLGYPRETASAAKGAVVIKNWKPLSFDKIAEGPVVSVGDILGELSTVATLRIQVFRSRPSVLSDMRDKLLRLLLINSHPLLFGSGCPLDELTLNQLCRGQQASTGPPLPEPSEEMRRKFEHWWSMQIQQQPHRNAQGQSQTQPPQAQQQQQRLTPSPRHQVSVTGARPHLSPGSAFTGPGDSALRRGVPVPGGMPNVPLDSMTLSHKLLDRTRNLDDQVHPALQAVHGQYPTPKTRMRTSFDPELELPKLQRWFAENQHPTRQQIQQYVRELNGLESRRGRKPLDQNNVVYWFKNARAAQKRAELRGSGPGVHYMSQNGYNSNSHSPPGASGAPHFLSPETLLTEGGHSGGPLGPRLLPMSLGGMPLPQGAPAWPLSSPPRAHMQRGGLPHAAESHLHRPQSVISDTGDDSDVDAEGGSGHLDDNEEHGDRNSPISLITANNNRSSENKSDKSIKEEIGEDCQDEGKKKDREGESKDDKDTELDVTNDDSRMSMKQESVEEDGSAAPSHNNNNNNHVKDCEAISDMEDDDDDEIEGDDASGSVQDGDEQHRRGGPGDHHLQERYHGFRSPSPCGQPPGAGSLAFPMIPNSMFGHNIMFMSQYLPGLSHPNMPSPGAPQVNAQGLNLSSDERRKRNRTFIDPVTEVPLLEQWFSLHTHPSHSHIIEYTEKLNNMSYRHKFPRLEPKNVQFWFKNRRAKCKRLKMSLFDNGPQSNHQQGVYQNNDLVLKQEHEAYLTNAGIKRE